MLCWTKYRFWFTKGITYVLIVFWLNGFQPGWEISIESFTDAEENRFAVSLSIIVLVNLLKKKYFKSLWIVAASPFSSPHSARSPDDQSLLTVVLDSICGRLHCIIQWEPFFHSLSLLQHTSCSPASAKPCSAYVCWSSPLLQNTAMI